MPIDTFDIDDYAEHVTAFGEWCRERDICTRSGILLAIRRLRRLVERGRPGRSGIDSQRELLAKMVELALSTKARARRTTTQPIPLSGRRRRNGEEVTRLCQQAIAAMKQGKSMKQAADTVGITVSAMYSAFNARKLGRPISYVRRPPGGGT